MLPADKFRSLTAGGALRMPSTNEIPHLVARAQQPRHGPLRRARRLLSSALPQLVGDGALMVVLQFLEALDRIAARLRVDFGVVVRVQQESGLRSHLERLRPAVGIAASW